LNKNWKVIIQLLESFDETRLSMNWKKIASWEDSL